MRSDESNDAKPEWAVRIRAIRGTRSQAEFARLCGVAQMTVSRWESGADQPNPIARAALARIAEEPHRSFFLQSAYCQDELPPSSGLWRSPVPQFLRRDSWFNLMRQDVPLLRDALYLGHPQAKEFAERTLSFPDDWFEDGEYWAIEVTGECMSPMIRAGDLAIVDINESDPEKLLDQIVAIRERDGVSVGWLREKRGSYVIAPEQSSWLRPSKPTLVDGEGSIAGKVVMWIGGTHFPVKL